MAWIEYENFRGSSLASIVFIASVIFLWWRGIRKSGLPPGPKRVPLLGFLPFWGKLDTKALADLGEKYGPIYSLNLGGELRVVLNGHDVMYKALVKRADVFSGRFAPNILQEFGAANGLVFREYGETWAKLRKFGMSTLKALGMGKPLMEDRMNEEVRYLLEGIRSKHGKAFDVQELLMSAVGNMIYSIVTGERMDYENEKFKRFIGLMSERYTGPTTAAKLKLMKIFPQLKYLPGFKTAYKNLSMQVNYTSAMLSEIVEEHQKTLDAEDPRNFIDAFLKELDRDVGSHFTREIMNTTIRDFFAAGTETTATTLRQCFLYLAANPEFQDRLRKEILSTFGVAGVLSLTKGDDMPLTQSFIHEIQRTKNAVRTTSRITTKDAVFEGYKIPKNTEVIVNYWQGQNDPEIFDDPLKFWPERFIDSEGRFQKHDHVIPYSVGPRYCVGQRLAEMEIFVFLTGILRNFSIVEDPKSPLPSFEEGIEGFVYSPLPYRARFVLI